MLETIFNFHLIVNEKLCCSMLLLLSLDIVENAINLFSSRLMQTCEEAGRIVSREFVKACNAEGGLLMLQLA